MLTDEPFLDAPRAQQVVPFSGVSERLDPASPAAASWSRSETSSQHGTGMTGSIDCLETDVLWARVGDDPQVRDELVRRFVPLARRLASRYRSINEPTEDLVQVAIIGLLGAIDRFDPDRGTSFQAFAIPTILGELKRHFRRTGWSVHVPRGAQEMALRVDRATRELSAQTGRSPRIQALAEHLDVGIEDALLGLDAGAAHYAASLDAPVAGDGLDEPQPLVEVLGAVDHGLDQVEITLSLQAAMTRLPHREREALTLRLEHGMKQAEIARRLDCSQMQISRLLQRASVRIESLVNPDLTVH